MSSSSKISTFKKLQILTNQLNLAFRNLLPLVLATVASILIFTLFILIRLHSSANDVSFLIFPLTMFDCVLIILVEFSSAGFISTNGQLYMNSIINKNPRIRMKLKPLEVQLGSFGHISCVAPILVLDFCICQTAGLLLII
jgi:hypothetical protein